MVAGATGIDLFLLVIDAAEGARPQTHEHLAILSLLGIERGVVAVTKADAVDAETLELAVEEARELVPGAEVVAVSAKTGAGLDELSAALARAADLVFQKHNVDNARRASTSTACSRCAGSGRSRPGRSGRDRSAPATSCAPSPAGATSACAASRCTTARSSAPSRVSGSRSRSRASSGTSCGGAMRCSRRGAFATELPARRRARGARADRRRRASACPPRHCRGARSRRAGGERLRAAPARRARRRGARRPRRPPRRDDRRRRHRPRPCASPPRRPGALRAGGARRGDVHAPVLVDGGWQLSEEWLEELRAELERGIDAADPLDPGVNAPVEPWAGEVLARLPFERSGSKLYRPGAGASLGERAAEAAAVEAELEAAAPAPVKVEDAELARFLERERAARAPRRRLRRLAGCLRTGAGARRRGVRARRADHARPLPRPRRLRPPRRSAPARAPRRGRCHPPGRRRARSQTFGVTVSVSTSGR